MIWSTPASEHEVLIFGLARQECWPHESLEVRCWSSPDLYLHHSEEKLYLKSCVTTRNAAKWMFPSRHCPEKLQEGIRNPVNVIERWGGGGIKNITDVNKMDIAYLKLQITWQQIYSNKFYQSNNQSTNQSSVSSSSLSSSFCIDIDIIIHKTIIINNNKSSVVEVRFSPLVLPRVSRARQETRMWSCRVSCLFFKLVVETQLSNGVGRKNWDEQKRADCQKPVSRKK